MDTLTLTEKQSRKHTHTKLSPFAPSGHVTKHLHPITSHLSPSLSLFLCLSLAFSRSLSHPVGICVLSQSREEKLGKKRKGKRDVLNE